MDMAVHILLKAKGYSVSNHRPFHPKMRTLLSSKRTGENRKDHHSTFVSHLQHIYKITSQTIKHTFTQ